MTVLTTMEAMPTMTSAKRPHAQTMQARALRWMCACTLALAIVVLSAQSAKAAAPEVTQFTAGASTGAAGAHPDIFTHFDIDASGGDFGHLVRTLRVELPPGLVGNPSAYATCPSLHASGGERMLKNCPVESQVGVASVVAIFDGTPPIPGAVYLMETPPDKPALLYLAFEGGSGVPLVPLSVQVRTDSDFGITVVNPEVSGEAALFEANVTIWGVPNAHERGGVPADALGNTSPVLPPDWPADQRPFVSNPTVCDAPKTTALEISFQAAPDLIQRLTAEEPTPTGCDQVPFEPQVSVEPTDHAADSPAGVGVHLDLPQDGLFDPTLRATSHLKDSRVTLPAGLTVNAGGADGLEACTTEQMGLLGTEFPGYHPIRFDNSVPTCPESSKLGSVGIDSPLLGENAPGEVDLEGTVYLAAQNQNPFGSTFAIYLYTQGRGVTVKLAGEIEADPVTGQLTTTFLDNPQLPFSRLSLDLRDGPRAPLATPFTCGGHLTESDLTPWSDPDHPVHVSSEFQITTGAGGGPCAATPAQRALEPGLSAGSDQAAAGEPSPFRVRLTRPDGNQEIERVELTPPQGVAATLAGVPYCPEAAIAAAMARTATGDGALEAESPSCPAASQVGTASIGLGAGSHPFHAGGNVYLAGPYKGAPVSLVFVVPALAGPFDLGVQVVRAAVRLDPRTAQITTVSDPLPRILAGVPLRIRDVRVDVDRPNFILNPTDCSEQRVAGQVFGDSGAVASVFDRFQLDGCAGLGFQPNLRIRLLGGNKRGDYQGLLATLTARPGDANIAGAVVKLPHSAFLAQEHIRTVCTRVQFAADQCPPGSVYGRATAVTPLLDEPLSGPVYLRSSDNPLPDLVAALRGPDRQPIEVELSGRVDAVKGALRNSFDVVPDAPVTRFTLELFRGKKGLIVNSQDLCRRHRPRATVRLTAQNGRRYNFRPVVGSGCEKKHASRGGRGGMGR